MLHFVLDALPPPNLSSHFPYFILAQSGPEAQSNTSPKKKNIIVLNGYHPSNIFAPPANGIHPGREIVGIPKSSTKKHINSDIALQTAFIIGKNKTEKIIIKKIQLPNNGKLNKTIYPNVFKNVLIAEII